MNVKIKSRLWTRKGRCGSRHKKETNVALGAVQFWVQGAALGAKKSAALGTRACFGHEDKVTALGAKRKVRR